MSGQNVIFTGLIVSPTSLDSLDVFTGFLVVENGKITNKGSEEELTELMSSDTYSKFSVIKLTDDQFLLPGFVDCHTHAPQFPNIGLGLDRPLLEWLDKYTFPLEKQYEDVNFAKAVYERVVKRLLHGGTTTACYFGSIHVEATLELAKAALSHHQRALVGKVSMNVKNDAGYYNETTKEISDVETFVNAIHNLKNDLITPVVTPRFAVSCDEELMTGLARISEKYHCPIQSHISENRKEVELVLETHPDCTSYAQVYDKNKLLNKRCIMAHAVYLTPEEMDLMASKGVSVAHCPASNTRLRSGLCPVRQLLQHQLTVGLGTDVSGGDSATILDAMRRAMDVSTHLDLQGSPGSALGWTEALYLATLGGAKALNLEDKVGSFDVGKEFDALVIDSYAQDCPVDRFPSTGEILKKDLAINLIQKFILVGDDRNIVQVYVKGQLVKNLTRSDTLAQKLRDLICN